MRNNLSPFFLQQVNSQETSEAFLGLLEFKLTENDGSITYYRYVNNKVAIDSGGLTYQASAFRLSLGSDKKDEVPTVSLTFDAGDRAVIRKLRELNKPPEISMSIVLSSNPDHVEIGPIDYNMEGFKVNATAVEISLIVEPILGEPVPCDRYTPKLFPGLWKHTSIL